MNTTKRNSVRSPKAPGINLEDALKRAEIFYNKEPTHSAPNKVFMRHIGYTENSGLGKVVLAALRGFGLIEKHGNSLALSSKALAIIQDRRSGSGERVDAIRSAAMQPKVHADVWEHFGGQVPSDENLHFYLTDEKAFTNKGADQFIKQFKATMEFSNLADGGILSPDESTDKEVESATSGHGFLVAQSSPTVPDTLTLEATMIQDTLTLPQGKVVLQWPATISQDDYQDVKVWLVLMGRRVKRAVATDGDKETESE